jgi:hypothetical protein
VASPVQQVEAERKSKEKRNVQKKYLNIISHKLDARKEKKKKKKEDKTKTGRITAFLCKFTLLSKVFYSSLFLVLATNK